MDIKRVHLLRTAARLYSLGEEVESARDNLRKLVAQGTSYDSKQMQAALMHFQELERDWRDLEREYLIVKEEIDMER